MDPSFLFYGGVISLIGVALVAIGAFLVYTDIFRTNPWSIALIMATVLWIVGESMGLLDTAAGHVAGWTSIKYVGLALLGPAWFGVATRFAAWSFWVGSRGTTLLGVAGTLFAFAVMTEPWHGLLAVPAPALGGARFFHAGPLWYVLIAFLFSCLLGGFVVVFREVSRFPRIIKRRGVLLMVVVAVPALCGLIDLFPNPLPPAFPLVPFGVACSSIVLMYGFFRLRMTSPLKLARAAVIDMLTDPVVVIDESMRIALVNPAARRIAAPEQPAVAGMRVDDAFPGLERMASTDGVNVESRWDFRDREYLVRTTFVENPRSSSRAVVATLSDVTALSEEKERLERIVEERTLELKRTNEELEESVARHEASERRLQAALADKDMLLKEIHHRVKNNLQIVTSLINMQANRLGDPDARSSYAAVTRRIKSISLVHERIYHSASFKKVELGRYIKDLVASIVSTVADANIPIKLEVEEKGLDVNPDACIDIGLMLNEILTNALKHGVIPSGAGSITVRVERIGDSIAFQVRDTGPGFSPEASEKKGSLGMTVVRAIASKYHASVSCTNDGGAVVTVVVPALKILAGDEEEGEPISASSEPGRLA
jgi:two-component sensor histidine kinase